MIQIFWQQVRRDRLNLPVWILGTALLLTVSANSVVSEYGDAEGRAQILAVALATPALLALRGIPNGDSVGSAIHFQSFAFLAVTIGLMNVFLATRHGRADEEKGRRELVLAAPVSRLAPTGATLLLGVIANAIFVVLAIGGYASTGVELSGATLSATALGLIGLAFLGLTMLAGEISQTARTANSIGVILVLGAYALRAFGDALGTPDVAKLTLEPNWLSGLSPIGWGQQTLAFTEDRAWPIAAIAGLAVAAIVAAVLVHARRELGASLVAERNGRATAVPSLRSPFALAWRLQAPALAAWAGGTALFGLVLASLITAVRDNNLDNPQIQAILESLAHAGTTQADITAAFLGAIMAIVGAVAAAAGVQAVLRMREEESEGPLESVLATPRSRTGWLLASTLVAALTVVVVLVAAGLAGALGFVALDDPDGAWSTLGAALVQAPAALAFTGITVLLFGLLPRVATALGWGVFGILTGVGLFGGLLGLPDGLERISPLANVPALPVEDWVPTTLVGATAVVATVLGALAFRRRDLSA